LLPTDVDAVADSAAAAAAADMCTPNTSKYNLASPFAVALDAGRHSADSNQAAVRSTKSGLVS
jgi:hypothetical protein